MSGPADLDERRRRAHRRAVVAIIVGAVVRALHAAGVVLVALGAAARLTSLVDGHGFTESPVWGAGPAGAITGAVLASALSALFFARAALRGAGAWLLAGLPAAAPPAGPPPVIRNVVDGLALGLGVRAPEIRVIDDPAPNAVSARTGGRAVLCVTSGLAELPRDEIEAVCAHEMAQLESPDARLFLAAFMALLRAETGSVWFGAAGFLIAGASLWAAWELGVFLPSVFAAGAVLCAVSLTAVAGLSVLVQSLRRAVDEMADVAAVGLARHPEALAAVLERLRRDKRRVAATTERSQWLWFEAVDKAVAGAGSGEAAAARDLAAKARRANARIDDELARRATLARATAAGLLPESESRPGLSPEPQPFLD